MNLAIINRGVVGSGKSTLAKLIKQLEDGLSKVEIHSTDSYHYEGDKYIYKPEMLREFHKKNFEEFKKSLKDSDIVICDNTNIRPFEYKKYVEAAQAEGFLATSVVFLPDYLSVHLDRNIHNVPEDVVERMIETLEVNIPTEGVDIGYVIAPKPTIGFNECILRLANEILK